jgi:putative DNA-invertase from lambdoid prophage Rac
VSGSSAIEQRPGFIKLLNKLEQDDVLIVTKLDRLGRNAIGVATTVARLAYGFTASPWAESTSRALQAA